MKGMQLNKLLRTISKQLVIALLITFFAVSPVVSARGYENLTVEQLERLGIYFTKGDYTCGGAGADPASATPGGTGDAALKLTAAQVANAKIIIGIAKSYNLGSDGAIIGVMVSLAETHLRMYASKTITVSQQNPAWKALPQSEQKVGWDHDSVGAFQQRVSSGWSTYGNYSSATSDEQRKNIVWQLMDTAYAAQAFFGTPPGAKLPGDLKQPSALKKGLQNDTGWKDRNPWVAAQGVQISAYDGRARAANNYSSEIGGNYHDQYKDAVDIVSKYYAAASPVPLPISVTGGTSSAPASGTANAADCPTSDSSLSGTATQRIIQTIAKYAWPDYCSSDARLCKNRSNNCPQAHNYCDTPNEMRKAYVDAVQAAKKKGEYIGDCQGVDCGGFVTRVMRDSGADPEYNKYSGNTAQQLRYLGDYSDDDALHKSGAPIRYHHIKDSEKLQSGDIAVQNNGSTHHTYFYVGKITGLDEDGKTVPFNGDAASASQCGRAPMASNLYDRGTFEWFRLVSK